MGVGVTDDAIATFKRALYNILDAKAFEWTSSLAVALIHIQVSWLLSLGAVARWCIRPLAMVKFKNSLCNA